jgi:MFS family permease
MSTSTDATLDELMITCINDPIVSIEKQNEADEFRRPLTTAQWILVCVGLYAGAIFYGLLLFGDYITWRLLTLTDPGLDTTIAADVQGPILESLGEIEKLAWVGIAFPMASVAMIPLFGTLYGLFEIKYLMIFSTILFELGSLLCGAAPTVNAMIVGRVIAGVGGWIIPSRYMETKG